jgi:hypothetical protein
MPASGMCTRAEAVKWLYKTELVRRRGSGRTIEQVELATLEYKWWWNTGYSATLPSFCSRARRHANRVLNFWFGQSRSAIAMYDSGCVSFGPNYQTHKRSMSD